MSHFWKILPLTLFFILPEVVFFFFQHLFWTQTLSPVTTFEPMTAAEGNPACCWQALGLPSVPDPSMFWACQMLPSSLTSCSCHTTRLLFCGPNHMLARRFKDEHWSGKKNKLLINFVKHTWVDCGLWWQHTQIHFLRWSLASFKSLVWSTLPTTFVFDYFSFLVHNM